MNEDTRTDPARTAERNEAQQLIELARSKLTSKADQMARLFLDHAILELKAVEEPGARSK